MAKKGIQTNGSNTDGTNSFFNPADFTIPTGTPPKTDVQDIQIPATPPTPQPTVPPVHTGTPAQGNADSGVEGDSGGKYDGLPKLYITLLGGTSSGKSSFMAGFVQSLVKGTKTLLSAHGTARISMKLIEYRSSDSLMMFSGSDSANIFYDAASLGGIIESLSFYWDKQTMRFPEGTTGNSKSYTFIIRVNGTPVATLTIMDYMGGYIDNPDQHTPEEMRELGVSCSLSHGIIVMADAEKIVQSMNGGDIMTETVQFHLNAAQINQLMFTISERASHPVTTVFAITKSDLPAVREKRNLCANDFQYAANLLADTVYNGAFDDLASKDQWWHAVIPVSAVGQDKVDERNNFKPNANIRQENIDMAMLFCIYSQLGLLIAEQTETVRQKKRRRYELRALFTTRRDRLARKEAHMEAQKVLDLLQKLQDIISAHVDDFTRIMPLVHMYGIGGIGRVEKGPQS